jgi:hypothetical protein
MHIAVRWNTDLLRESLVSCHSRLSVLIVTHNPD